MYTILIIYVVSLSENLLHVIVLAIPAAFKTSKSRAVFAFAESSLRNLCYCRKLVFVGAAQEFGA